MSSMVTSPRVSFARLGKRLGLWGIPVGLLALAGLCLAILAGRDQPALVPPPIKLANVEVLTIQLRDYRETLELPARLIAEQVATLSAETTGRLDRWLVAEGERVTSGQVVAEINADELQASLAELQAGRAAAEAGIAVAASQIEAAAAGQSQALASLQAAKLAWEAGQADFEFRRREFERVRQLHDQQAASAAELDAATNALTQGRLRAEQAGQAVAMAEQAQLAAAAEQARAAATVELAKRQLAQVDKSIERLRVQLDKTQIKAPFAGRIDQRLAETGEWLAPGTAVVRLYDNSRMRAVVNVGDRYVPFLDRDNLAVSTFIELAMPGAVRDLHARIILPGMPKLTGGVYSEIEMDADLVRVAQASDPLSNTYQVELQIANPGEALRQGIIVRARIDFLVYPQALVVPLRSLAVTDSGTRVLVAESRADGDYASVRSIEPLSIQQDTLLVRGELAGGERLIIAGGKGLVDGERVNVLVADGVLAGDAPATAGE